MVKRVKRASAVVYDHPTPSSYPPVAEEHSRARLKIQSLQNDYEELARETDSMKRKLQIAKNQKRLLSSQVKFLWEKYRLLTENPPRNPTTFIHRTKMSSRNNKPSVVAKADRPLPYHATHHHAQHLVEVDITRHPSMRIDKPNNNNNNTEQFASTSNATTTGRKKILALDLNETTPQFLDDPNEFHHSSWQTNPASATWDRQLQLHHRVSEPDPAGAADLKLAVCRNVGKDASARSGGKRKITWQDQVALRV